MASKIRLQKGQSTVEATILIALVAVGLVAAFPYIRNGLAWMWKSSADQMSGFVPYAP